MNSKMRTAGFTLIELMIGVVMGAIVILGAVAFAGHEVRTMGKSNQVLEMAQVGRAAMDLLVADLVNSGVGVGYREDMSYAGVEIGNFTRDGVVYNSNNNAIALGPDGNATTDDLGLRMADGVEVTIISYSGGAGTVEVCAPEPGQPVITPNEFATLHTANGLSAKSVQITAVGAPVACSGAATCVGAGTGCLNITFSDPPAGRQYVSGPSAATENYDGGWFSSGYKEVTWKVVPQGGTGVLTRETQLNYAPACVGATCGEVVANNVDSLQVRTYLFDTTAAVPTWVDLTTGGVPSSIWAPMRVDIELVLRVRAIEPEQTHALPELALENGACLTGGVAPCPQSMFRRLVMRRSIEIKNAGKMRIN